MEPISTIAMTTVAILVPFFKEAGKSFASKAGEAAWNKCEDIYQAIRTRFQGKTVAEEALEDFKKNPEDEDYQGALRKEIRKTLEGDKLFYDQLSKMLSEAKEVGIVVSGSGAVATSGGTAAGESGIAIHGNMEGDINQGIKKST